MPVTNTTAVAEAKKKKLCPATARMVTARPTGSKLPTMAETRMARPPVTA